MATFNFESLFMPSTISDPFSVTLRIFYLILLSLVSLYRFKLLLIFKNEPDTFKESPDSNFIYSVYSSRRNFDTRFIMSNTYSKFLNILGSIEVNFLSSLYRCESFLLGLSLN